MKTKNHFSEFLRSARAKGKLKTVFQYLQNLKQNLLRRSFRRNGKPNTKPAAVVGYLPSIRWSYHRLILCCIGPTGREGTKGTFLSRPSYKYNPPHPIIIIIIMALLYWSELRSIFKPHSMWCLLLCWKREASFDADCRLAEIPFQRAATATNPQLPLTACPLLTSLLLFVAIWSTFCCCCLSCCVAAQINEQIKRSI